MPYYHIGCGGQISLFTRKCHECGKKWPVKVLFQMTPPRDMTRFIIKPSDSLSSPEKFASKLPRWPRWARITSVAILLLTFILIIYFLTRYRG